MPSNRVLLHRFVSPSPTFNKCNVERLGLVSIVPYRAVILGIKSSSTVKPVDSIVLFIRFHFADQLKHTGYILWLPLSSLKVQILPIVPQGASKRELVLHYSIQDELELDSFGYCYWHRDDLSDCLFLKLLPLHEPGEEANVESIKTCIEILVFLITYRQIF